MKKNLFLIPLIAFVVLSCKKETPQQPTAVDTSDKTPPTITLKGKTNDTISLGSAYTDPGAIGADDKDGDISPFIVVSGTVNTKVTGDNQIEYNLRDAGGNSAQKTIRKINIRNDAYFMEGNYTVSCNCETVTLGPTPTPTLTTNTNYTTSVTTSTINNNGFFPGTLNLGHTNVNQLMVLKGSLFDLSIGNLAYPGNGSGILNSTKNGFTITTESRNTYKVNDRYKCTIIYIKM